MIISAYKYFPWQAFELSGHDKISCYAELCGLFYSNFANSDREKRGISSIKLFVKVVYVE